MPRKNPNNDHNHRGRGGRGRGRGRGAYRGSNARGRANEEYPHASRELDCVVQRYPQGEFAIPDMPRGSESTSRSRSGGKIPQRGTDSPLRGNGHGTPRGRGQNFGPGNGRGRGNAQYRARGWSLGMSQRGRGIETKQLPNRDASLSDLLYFERPLLRPIKFVRAAHTPFLFRESEEIFQSPLTSNDPAVQSDVPTAERVACIFNNTQPCLRADTISEGETSDELEEIDFADLGTFRARFDGVEHMAQRKMKPHPGNAINGEAFTGTYNKEQLRELSQAQETDRRTTTWEEKSTAVAANDTTLRTLEQSVETLQMTENHHVRAFSDDRSPRTPSKSVAIESTLSKPNNACANMKPEADLSMGNTTSKSRDVFETAATAGTESNGGDHGYFIDTQPSQPFTSHSASDVNPTDGNGRGEILGEEEEIIVYVAPYPRPGRVQPTHDTTPCVDLPTCSILTGTSETRSASKEQKGVSIIDESPVPSNPQLSLHSMSLDFQRAEPSTQPRYPTAFTPSQKRKAKLHLKTKQSRIARHRNSRIQFRAFGAMLSESQIRDADEEERRDPKWETRRKGDSDIDWGDDSDDMERSGMGTDTGALVIDGADAPANSEGGMDLDPDIGLDMNAMERFVESMSAEGSHFVTVDDIEDQRKMTEEDQDKASAHTAEDSNDEDESGSGSEEDEEEEDVLQLEEQLMIAESEGEGLELDSNDEDALPDGEPSAEKESVNNRRIMHSEAGAANSPSKRRMKAKDKADYLPEDLQAQWERDRAKKAENKRLRKEARILASLDPFAPKKGGKKARKLMMTALKQMDHRNGLDDMPNIEVNMRRFVENIDGRRSMPLLPMDKSTRKIVHDLATAFNLKSHSKGKGPGRYITLVKTTRTGIINEGKVKAIVKRATRGSGRAEEGSQKKGRPHVPSHREGDEVGKEAPAIGEGNVGFKMLSSMGWSEGARIGGDTSVGIEVPLTAVIKKSRLGLGATRT